MRLHLTKLTLTVSCREASGLTDFGTVALCPRSEEYISLRLCSPGATHIASGVLMIPCIWWLGFRYAANREYLLLIFGKFNSLHVANFDEGDRGLVLEGCGHA